MIEGIDEVVQEMDSAVAACASKGLDREPQVSPLDAATLEESAKGTCLSRSCSAVAGVLLVFLGFVRGRTRDDSLLLKGTKSYLTRASSGQSSRLS